jgi:glycosyltransferase involved in cell wall biosynthesis
MSEPRRASVVVRAKDEAASIGRTLELLASQTAELQTIVVDSGSRDETVAIARGAGAEVVEIPAESFTYGHALNVGCERAREAAIIALSAHAFPLDDGWAARMVAALDDERVACAVGYGNAPEGGPLRERRVQDIELARRYPRWGYSNGQGVFRAELWRARPFREDMPGVEDKEWAWHWMERGYVSIVDPGLSVDHQHHHEGVRERFDRQRREWLGLGMFVDIPEELAPGLLREWWTELDGRRSRVRARLSPRRAAELAGKYAGCRAARRR